MRCVVALVVMVALASVASLSATGAQQDAGATFTTLEHGGTQIDVVIPDLTRVQLGLAWKRADGTPFTSMRALAKELPRPPLVVTNAGIYGKDLAPLGLHVENGRVVRPINVERGGGNFFLKPNGVFFLVDGKAGVLETREFLDTMGEENVQLATQSGPMLVRRGDIHHAFKKGSDKRAVRNGVGVRSPTEIVLAVSRGPISMHDFATVFRDVLGCQDALFLDGTISQMHAPAAGRSVGVLGDGRFVGLLFALPRAE